MIVGLLCASCMTIFPFPGTSTSIWRLARCRSIGCRSWSQSKTSYSSFPAYLSTLHAVGRIAGFDFLPPLYSYHASFYANDCIWSWVIRRGQRVTPVLFQKNSFTNFDRVLLCVSAPISISFHLRHPPLSLSRIRSWRFSSWETTLFSSYPSAKQKLFGTLPRHRMGCGTIVANRPLNLLFKCFPFNLSSSS